MYARQLAVTLFVISLSTAFIAHAQVASPSAIRPAQARIESDEGAGVIRFYVKGQLAGVLGETGLHIRNNISYGGNFADYGPAGFEAHNAAQKNVAHAH